MKFEMVVLIFFGAVCLFSEQIIASPVNKRTSDSQCLNTDTLRKDMEYCSEPLIRFNRLSPTMMDADEYFSEYCRAMLDSLNCNLDLYDNCSREEVERSIHYQNQLAWYRKVRDDCRAHGL